MPATVDSINRLQVPFIVQIGRRQVSLGEVVDLLPGALLELPVNAEDDLEIHINNKLVGHGRAVKVGENYGIQVAKMAANDVVTAAAGAAAAGEASKAADGAAAPDSSEAAEAPAEGADTN